MSGLFATEARLAFREGKNWVTLPFAVHLINEHEQVQKDLEVVKDESCGWNVDSPLDLGGRVALLSLNAFIVNPLLALASLLEGVIRAIVGGSLLLASFIPCKGNENVAEFGKGLLRSTIISGMATGFALRHTVKDPALASWATVRYIWDTTCCTKTGKEAEEDLTLESGGSRMGDHRRQAYEYDQSHVGRTQYRRGSESSEGSV